MEFIEASAKRNTNIQEAFAKLAKQICEVKAHQQPTLPLDQETDLTPSFTLQGKNTVVLEEDNCKKSCGC